VYVDGSRLATVDLFATTTGVAGAFLGKLPETEET
jgi:hypothetical protein